MGNTFKSWNEINESTRSAQVYIAPNGQKFKIVIKMQDNTKFIIKTVNEMEVLDGNSNMTNDGATALKNYLNSQQAFLNTYGKLDSNFFKTRFIAYTVVKDTARTEKIQFTIVPRSEVEGLDANAQFVSTKALEAIQNKSEILAGIITDNQQSAQSEQLPGDVGAATDGGTSDASGTNITEESMGNKFRYTMRTNGIDYECEIGENGAIEMEPLKGTGPIGSIAWEDSKVIWYTDADNTGIINNSPLMMDGEIENSYDKRFFTKIFTDKEFKNKVIAEWEAKYGDSELTGENLKGMLYYRDGNPIFATSSTASVSNTDVTGSVDSVDTYDAKTF